MSSLTGFGVFLWVVLTLLPIVIARQQFRYFRTLHRYTFQPAHGSKYSDNINPNYIRYLCIFLQLILFAGLLVSLSLNHWGYLGDANKWGSVSLGLINYSRSPDSGRMSLSCNIDYVDQLVIGSYVYPDFPMSVDGTACFLVVGSSIVVFIFSLICLLLSVFQLAALQAVCKWRYFTETQPGQDISTAMSGGLWSRAHVMLILSCVMTFMYGVLPCAIGGVRPGVSFFILIGVTVVTIIQYFCVARYIQSLPTVRLPPAMDDVEPSDFEVAYAAAEETVAAAVALAASATATIEKLRICIAKQEAEAAAVAADGAQNQPHDDLRSLTAAEAMIRTASETASAATIAARAGISALQPLLHVDHNGNRDARNPHPDPNQQNASILIRSRANSLRNQNNLAIQQSQSLPGSSHVELASMAGGNNNNNRVDLDAEGIDFHHQFQQPSFHIDNNDDEEEDDVKETWASSAAAQGEEDVKETWSSSQGEDQHPVNEELPPEVIASLASSSVISPNSLARLDPQAAAPLDASVVLHVDAAEGSGAMSSYDAVETSEQENQLPSPSKKV